MPISFSQKPKDITKPLNKETNVASLDDESTKFESEYPQMLEMTSNGNDVAESRNTDTISNWKSSSTKVITQILNLVNFYCLYLKWCH